MTLLKMDLNQRSILLISALDAFKALEDAIFALSDQIKLSKPQLYLPSEDEAGLYPVCPKGNEDRILMALSDLWYRNDEKGVSTRKYKGVVICNQTTINLVKDVNSKKDSFAEAVRKIRDASELELKKFKLQMRDYSFTRDELTSMGMKRINLNHCYRHIHFFEDAPLKVQYSQSSNELSIKRVTKKQAKELLEKVSEQQEPVHIKMQLSKLASLSSETKLAIARNIAPHFKVNLFYPPSNIDGKLLPITRKPGLPVFILDNGSEIDIRFKRKNARKEEVKTRSDKCLEDEVFLPSVSIYRYIA